MSFGRSNTTRPLPRVLAVLAAGVVFGYLLVGIGLAELLAGAVAGLWLMVLGGFILGSAGGSRDEERVKDVACGMTDVLVAEPATTLADILPLLGGCAQGRAIVLEDRRLVGIVTRNDVARALEAHSVTRGAA